MGIGSVIKNFLKETWDSLQQSSYMHPSEEIRDALEKKGYQFEYYCHANYMAVVSGFNITNPQGQRVYCAADNSAWEGYKRDYIAAEKALEAQTAETGTNAAPRPPER